MAEAPQEPSSKLHEPPEGGKKVFAMSDQTLCGIAVDHGFSNCEKLRALPGNKDYLTRPLRIGDYVHVPKPLSDTDSAETEKTHEYVRSGLPKASIRFVHGSKDKPFKNDRSLSRLQVSNFRTDKAGKDYDKPFVDETKPNRKYEEHADADEDTFKVEVLDCHANDDDKPVEMDALRPIFSSYGSITEHEDFPGDRSDGASEAGKRKLDVDTSKQGTTDTKRFRTGYLRLVVDEYDKGTLGTKGRPKQTLLVTDGIDQAQAADQEAASLNGDAKDKKLEEAKRWRDLEILDQAVRARYKIQGCPGDESATVDGKKVIKCQVTKTLPVGGLSTNRAKMFLHVLCEPGGAPIVDIHKALDWAKRCLRRVYAQANMTVKCVDAQVQAIKLPANMIFIGGPTGKKATGGNEIKVKIKIDAHAEQTVSITTVANDSPGWTAAALAREIRKKLGEAKISDVRVNDTENAPATAADGQSADIIIGDPNTQMITLTLVKDGDPGVQKARIVRLTKTDEVYDFDSTYPSHVGTPDERILLKNYDTGSDRIDVVLVKEFKGGIWGEAFRPKKNWAYEMRPKREIVNSGMFDLKPINDKTASYSVLPHELGHVLFDMVHVANWVFVGGKWKIKKSFRPELMVPGGKSDTGDYKEHEVNGPKRIYDSKAPMALTKHGTGANPVTTSNPKEVEGASVKWINDNNFSVTTVLR